MQCKFLIISLVVAKYGWVSMEEFINFLTISQITPTYCDKFGNLCRIYKEVLILGSIITTLAVVLP